MKETSEYAIEGRLRESAGTASSRRLRAQGQLPAVIYGPNLSDNMHVVLDHNQIRHALKKSSFHTQVIDLKVDGKVHHVVLKNHQNHPCRDEVLHLDFYLVDPKTPISAMVPLKFINQDIAKGVKLGGVLQRYMSEVRLVALPHDLPRHVVVDVAQLDVEGWVFLRDLELPEGVKLYEGKAQHANLRVVTILRKRGQRAA